MTYNQRNQELLNKKKAYSKMCQEEIQLQIISNNPRSKPVYPSQEVKQHYYILEDNNHMPSAQAPRKLIEQLPVEKPFSQKIITMNGDTFKLVEHKPKVQKPSKSKLPTMLVSCHKCSTVQTVPGTANIFDCGVCSLRNSCVPINAILRCYSCNAKVLYSVGSSQFIKCTKCSTINEINTNEKNVRGQTQVNPNYKVFFDKNQMQTEHKANPYLRYTQESQLQQLLSEQSIKKYPDL